MERLSIVDRSGRGLVFTTVEEDCVQKVVCSLMVCERIILFGAQTKLWFQLGDRLPADQLCSLSSARGSIVHCSPRINRAVDILPD